MWISVSRSIDPLARPPVWLGTVGWLSGVGWLPGCLLLSLLLPDLVFALPGDPLGEAVVRPCMVHPAESSVRDRLGLALGALAVAGMAGLMLWLSRRNWHLHHAKLRLEQRQRSILDAMSEGVYGLDTRGRTLFVNRATETLTGWSAAELLGGDQHARLHHTHADGEPYPREACPVLATCQDRQVRFVDNEVFWRRDGTCFPVEYSVAPLRDGRDRPLGAVVVFRDVSARQQAAERLRQLELEIAHQARLSALGEMAAGLGHELNQPLTAIGTNARACLRLLDGGEADPTLHRDTLNLIANQAERAAEVVRQMRRFARKEAPQLEPVAVAALFETLRLLLAAELRHAEVALQSEIAPDVPAVMAQRTQIEQVLLNLAHNAIEAMAGQSGERLLLLRARRQGGRIELRMIDTGPGLPRGIARHLFTPFQTTKPRGLGLGLSICARILDAHDSRLEAETTPNIGSSFSFTLAATEAAPVESERAA